jgi:hypothetical protein
MKYQTKGIFDKIKLNFSFSDIFQSLFKSKIHLFLYNSKLSQILNSFQLCAFKIPNASSEDNIKNNEIAIN